MFTSSQRWIATYVVALGAVAVALLVVSSFEVPVLETARFWQALGTLIALGIATETFSLQTSVGGSTTAISFVPYLASMLLLGPEWAMVVAGTSEFVAETLVRRKPLIKVVHNTSKEIVAIFAAATIYMGLGGSHSYVEFSVAPAILLATLAYFLITNGSTAIALSLSTTTDREDIWRSIVGPGILQYDLMASALSVLLAFLYIELSLFGVLLVIVPMFFVRHAHHANLKLAVANRELLSLMVKSIEARDPYTSGHSLRVAGYAKVLARAIGLAPREVQEIETAALLHDVGKIHEEYAPILRKEGKLTSEELRLMQTHPIRSADLVGTISALHGIVQNCVRHHHENFDGTGYPDGLAGDEIPLGSRIIMIADTADAMTTDRPYRKALSFDRLTREVDKYAGSQFDPRLVETFRSSSVLRRAIEERQRQLAQGGRGTPETFPSLAVR